MSEVIEQQQNESGKIEKKFQQNLKKAIALLGGEQILKPIRQAKASEITAIIEELTKEDREKAKEEAKTKLKAMLDAYVKFGREVAEKKKELAKLEEQKKKEFNEAADKFFTSLSGVDAYMQELQNALNTAAGGVEEKADAAADDTNV